MNSKILFRLLNVFFLSGQNPCGVPLNQGKDGRVIGGEDAARGAWPWQAALERIRNPSETQYNHNCGGSILTNDYVLTAAHCVNTFGYDRVFILICSFLTNFESSISPIYFLQLKINKCVTS